MGQAVSVYFTEPGKQKTPAKYRTYAQRAPSNGLTWNFEAISASSDLITLAFEGLERVPESFEVWLVDEVANTRTDLRETAEYEVAGAGPTSPRKFKLIVGDAGFQAEMLAELDLLPDHFELLQNFPNPFSNSTTIPFNLPEDEVVSLTVYDLLGKRVATLVHQETLKAGRHIAVWDGYGMAGKHIASGVYFVRIKAGSFTDTRKVMHVK